MPELSSQHLPGLLNTEVSVLNLNPPRTLRYLYGGCLLPCVSARTQDWNFSHRFSFRILEMKINPDHVLSHVLFPPLLALPPHQAQTIELLVPCSTHLPVSNSRLGSLPGWPSWSKVVSGTHAFFCAQWSEGYIPFSTNTAHNKMGGTRRCSLAAVATSGCRLYKQ